MQHRKPKTIEPEGDKRNSRVQGRQGKELKGDAKNKAKEKKKIATTIKEPLRWGSD